jgi:CDP-diacylglycerol--serine O-phosphatidyltransferase
VKPTPTNPSRRSALVSAWQRWGARKIFAAPVDELPCIAVAADQIETLADAVAFRETLLALIAQAKRRILIATLYLQDDDAGREVLAALYAAKAARPQLEIVVFVDWHRAQRGLIGKARSAGNAAMYKEMAQKFGPGVEILGVPVQRREFLGVLHLKGFVIDDQVLYSGASLNDVYLQKHGRYRIDRYHLIGSPALADSMAEFLTTTLRGNAAVQPLASGRVPRTATLKTAIVKLRRELAKSRYHFAGEEVGKGEVGVTPLLGIGVRGNELNAALVQLIERAQKRIVVFTPYFNLPGAVRKVIARKIKSGCRVTIVLGDKTANDFYIPPAEPFKTIGALPYLYEANLRRFCKTHQRAIDAGVLNVHLWRDGDNTFHLKGILVDDEHALLTGNNLNPRAWRLDLENGLLIRDPEKLLLAQHLAELDRLMAHAKRLPHHTAIDAVDSYPAPVQRLIKRLARVRADRLVNQML